MKDVKQAKMLVVIGDGDAEVLDCTFMHYGGQASWDGEVFINAMQSAVDTREQTTLSLMYGTYSNEIALTTKSYNTSVADDLMSVSTTYGSTSDDAVITITITEISTTAIKGTFIGKLSTKSGLVDIKGAFWATPEAQN
jgi:hypothetical protein